MGRIGWMEDLLRVDISNLDHSCGFEISGFNCLYGSARPGIDPSYGLGRYSFEHSCRVEKSGLVNEHADEVNGSSLE